MDTVARTKLLAKEEMKAALVNLQRIARNALPEGTFGGAWISNPGLKPGAAQESLLLRTDSGMPLDKPGSAGLRSARRAGGDTQQPGSAGLPFNGTTPLLRCPGLQPGVENRRSRYGLRVAGTRCSAATSAIRPRRPAKTGVGASSDAPERALGGEGVWRICQGWPILFAA